MTVTTEPAGHATCTPPSVTTHWIVSAESQFAGGPEEVSTKQPCIRPPATRRPSTARPRIQPLLQKPRILLSVVILVSFEIGTFVGSGTRAPPRFVHSLAGGKTSRLEEEGLDLRGLAARHSAQNRCRHDNLKQIGPVHAHGDYGNLIPFITVRLGNVEGSGARLPLA